MSGSGCAACLRIRWFVMAAVPLVAGIYLQPDWATAAAERMPSALTIGVTMSGLAAVVFAVRLTLYLRAPALQRQTARPPRR